MFNSVLIVLINYMFLVVECGKDVFVLFFSVFYWVSRR